MSWMLQELMPAPPGFVTTLWLVPLSGCVTYFGQRSSVASSNSVKGDRRGDYATAESFVSEPETEPDDGLAF